MAANDRSSYINLYSHEDKSDNAYKFMIENKQAKVFVDAKAPLEFSAPAGAYQFVKADDSVFNLESRFASLENDGSAATNAADIAQLQQDLAAEGVARQSADTTNANAIAAETAARTTAVNAVAADVVTENNRAQAAEGVNAQAIADEEAARITAVAAEQARAEAAEVALGVRIDNVLSNVDPAAQDSLAELLAAYQAADSSLGDSITAALARITDLENQFAALTSQ